MSAQADPAIDAEVVTPGTDVTNGSRGLYVGVGGDVVVVTSKGNQRTFKGVPTGAVLPIRVRQVVASGTTATDILALY
jgi:hypothetical protein